MRLALTYEARTQRQRVNYEIAQAARREGRTAQPGPHEPPAPALPDLAQVTGWSKASGKPDHDAGRAVFGGWRLGMEEPKE